MTALAYHARFHSNAALAFWARRENNTLTLIDTVRRFHPGATLAFGASSVLDASCLFAVDGTTETRKDVAPLS